MQISKDGGSTYSSSLTLARSGTSVPTTTIYVRLTGAALGSYSGNITHTSSGAATQNVAVSGTVATYYTLTVNAGSGGSVTLNPTGGSYASGTVVTLNAVAATGYIFYGWSGDVSGSTNPATITMNGNKFVTATFVAGTCSTVNLTATEDTYLSAADVTFNNGGNTQLHVDATTDTSRRTTLLKWDLSVSGSGIPTAATVSAASLSLYVEDASPLVFNLYNMRRTWVEGTSNRAASTTSANWNTYNGTTSWGTVGAANTELGPVRHEPVERGHDQFLHHRRQDPGLEPRRRGGGAGLGQRVHQQLRPDHAELLGGHQQRRILYLQ